VLCCVAQSCAPDQAFSGLQRWLESGGGASVPAWHERPLLEIMCQLFAATPALSEYLIRFPARTRSVLEPLLGRPAAGAALLAEPCSMLPPEADTHAARLAFVRHKRIEQTLRIAALDLLGRITMPDTAAALSDLADASLALALETAVAKTGALPGEASLPTGTLPFVVFALGKLGGRELNYSSDIDLVFVYGGNAEGSDATRSAELQTWYTALARNSSRRWTKSPKTGAPTAWTCVCGRTATPVRWPCTRKPCSTTSRRKDARGSGRRG